MTRVCKSALSSLVVALYCPVALPADRQYDIKQDKPRTGSVVRRYEVRNSTLPINKRFHELNASERELLNSLYENIQPGDEPPFPAEGLKTIYDAVGKAQQKLLVSGTLILVVTVSPSGDASAVKAIGSPSDEMTKFAASVLMLTKFKPAVCGGSPCQMDYPFSFSFAVR